MMMPAPLNGINMDSLIGFVEKHGDALANLTTRQVLDDIIKPSANDARESFVNSSTPTEERKAATVFVSHCWDYLFLDFYDNLISWWTDNGECADDYFWIDVFVVNFHATSNARPPEWIPTVIKACPKVTVSLVVAIGICL